MKNVKFYLLAVVLFAVTCLPAQVSINTDGAPPDASSMLDVKSNSKGVLIPRLTRSQIESISNPANGLIVFNTDNGKLYVYLASDYIWKEVQYGPDEILYPASIVIGSGGSCSNTAISGDYIRCVALTSSNTVTIDANVLSPGIWSISTDTINGYSFAGSAIATTTGTQALTLTGAGTPAENQSDTFTATVTVGGNSTCTFQIVVTIPDCDDGYACTTDSYNPNTCSCENIPVDCDDGNACTDDYCDPNTGNCVHNPVYCDDGNPCTVDSCDPYVGCIDMPVDCDDGDPCTIDSCDPYIGGCVHTPVDCDDGNPCTVDSCDGNGNCVHTPVNCDDGNACTDDHCDPNTGNCIHTPVDCDDGDPNTIDTCDSIVGCIHTQVKLPQGPKKKAENLQK